MSQSLSQIYLHIVFSTKERRPFLQDKPIRERLHAYLKGICDKQNCPSLKIRNSIITASRFRMSSSAS